MYREYPAIGLKIAPTFRTLRWGIKHFPFVKSCADILEAIIAGRIATRCRFGCFSEIRPTSWFPLKRSASARMARTHCTSSHICLLLSVIKTYAAREPRMRETMSRVTLTHLSSGCKLGFQTSPYPPLRAIDAAVGAISRVFRQIIPIVERSLDPSDISTPWGGVHLATKVSAHD